jgi:hypothetical protein
MNIPAASDGELTQAPQPPSPSPEGEGEQEVKKLKTILTPRTFYRGLKSYFQNRNIPLSPIL